MPIELLSTDVTEKAGAMTAHGLITFKSSHAVNETVDRLEVALKAKGVTVFARIDHALGAELAGFELRPTVLLIFGSPKAGTPLMQADQLVGIDLPLKVLIWRDGSGAVWLTYNDPHWIAQRHGLGATVKGQVDIMAAMLASLVREAASG